jgi:hypothetical protein
VKIGFWPEFSVVVAPSASRSVRQNAINCRCHPLPFIPQIAPFIPKTLYIKSFRQHLGDELFCSKNVQKWRNFS